MRKIIEIIINFLTCTPLGVLRAIGFFVIAPLCLYAWDFFFNRGNTDALKYVNYYIENSEIIQIVYPDYDMTDFKIKGYKDQYRHKKRYYGETFYSDSLKKYISIIMFEGVDYYNKEKKEGDLGAGRLKSYYIKGNVFLVRVNRMQLHDYQYGTKGNPVPVFWYKFVSGKIEHRVNKDGTTYNSAQNNPYFTAQDTVSNEANKLFVGEYLSRFLSPKELERLFNDVNSAN